VGVGGGGGPKQVEECNDRKAPKPYLVPRDTLCVLL
jgi:hypothetical protein